MLFKNRGWMGAARTAMRRRGQARVPWWLLLTSAMVAGLVWLLYREGTSTPPPGAEEEAAEGTPGVPDDLVASEVSPELVDPGRQAVVERMARTRQAEQEEEQVEGTPTWEAPDLGTKQAAETEIWAEAVREAPPEAEAEAGEVILGWAGVGEVEAPFPPDDLTLIEGIGPKIAHVLRERGIRTFAALAARDVERLRQLLREAGLPVLADPETWPEQARLLAEGDMAGLHKLQDELRGGRRRV